MGLPTSEDVVLRRAPLEELRSGQVLIENLFISMDPAIRDWMSDGPSYLPPIELGAPVRSTTVGRVVKSMHENWRPGDLAIGLNGWEEFSIADGDFLAPVDNPEGYPLSNYLSIFGAVGMTSYFALLEVGKPIAGETLLVSAAAGAVGSVVGQIGKILGCRVVGLAGSEEKCQWLKDDLGFDAAINYRTSSNLANDIRVACPDGVDIYYDNVGGALLDAALLCINDKARIVFCGAISAYNSTDPVPGPYNLWQLLAHSARLEGFLVRHYVHRFPEGIAQMKTWVKEGKIQFREDVREGLDNALPTFHSLFDGSNNGKLILKVARSANDSEEN